jgi:hypothetical protein
MNPRVSFLHRLCLFLLASVLVAGGNSLTAAPGGRRALVLELSADRQTAKVSVPDGVGTVTLQRFQREGGWQKFATKNAKGGVLKFKLPASGAEVRWRAIGRYEVAAVSHDKFPTAFYKGKSSFSPGKAAPGNVAGPLGQAGTGSLTDKGTGSIPEEADIWKIDGSTVYFFNQLRGLQVLDLKNPADPHLTASLRLPAVGQDLYLLPGSGDRSLVLLTESWSDQDGQRTRINVVKVSGSSAQIVQTRDVPGSLADSRLVGNRLILATTEWNDASTDSSGAWTSRSRLSEWLLSPDKAPRKAAETLIEGDSPLISSGPDWLAVAVYPNGQWNVSEVSVFAVRPSGLVRMAAPFRTVGAISNKFAMNWNDNVFTTVSEKNWTNQQWSPTTVLENFRAWAPEAIHPLVLEGRLGSLQLAKGESLFATRFANDKAYVVTYLQTDPLFVVDLSDPNNPVIAGQLEVPGWSSHLEPIGDLLLAIGWDSGTVAASLFDVANPASPQLLRRIALGDSGTYSEALWDEKALKVLPDAGLAMIPLTSYSSGTTSSVVQLLDIDVAGRDLKKRGTIAHAFEARRADLIGDAVVSISQRVLAVADIADQDAPKLLAEVTLAWPVDRVLDAGNFLVQIEDGNSYGGGTATARISPAGATEEILAETDLGEGTVKAAELRRGKLFVLREIAPAQPYYYYLTAASAQKSPSNSLSLDVYDTSALPALSLLGSCSVDLGTNGRTASDHLLWPQPNRPAVVVDFRNYYWFGWGGGIFLKSGATLADTAAPKLAAPGTLLRPWINPASQKAPRLVFFNTTLPQVPKVGESLPLGPDGSYFTGTGEAADGLTVLGISYPKATGEEYQAVRVIESEITGSPIVRPLIDVPGSLFAITELDSKGFLAFTRNYDSDQGTTLDVSASDGYTAFQIASVNAPDYGAVAAGGRRLFVANSKGVDRYLLGDDGSFTQEPALKTGWQPYDLEWTGGHLIGSDGSSLFDAADGSGSWKQWQFNSWYLSLARVSFAGNGDLLVPFGDYGTERLAH